MEQSGTAVVESPGFPVSWPNPADAELTWERDDMHVPHALAPLAADYLAVLSAGIDASLDFFGSSVRIPYRTINGYAYYAGDYGVPDAEVAALFDAIRDSRRAFAPKAGHYWQEECLPTLLEIYADMSAIDVDGADGADLVEAWRRTWDAMVTVWTIHMIITGAAYRVLEDLADRYERAIPGVPAGEAPRLIQGARTILREVDLAIAGLADLVAARPVVADRLAVAPAPSLAELERLDGGDEVGSAIRAFLEQHGHVGQPFDDLLLPSWAESPGIFLAELGQRAASVRASGTSAVLASEEQGRKLRAEASELTTAIRTRLEGRPDELEALDAQLALAHEIGHLTETHNYWIDRMGQARLRELATRLGARLVRDGVFDHADDVFYLYREEIADLILVPVSRRELIAERREEHRRNLARTAPTVLGKPLVDLGVSSRFDQDRVVATDLSELKGIGASAGIVRGPARIVLREDDFASVTPGDIVVAPSASPSWVSIFPIAGGLVTNTGGALSHAAVVAREFGLPAVVGAAGATTLIPAGQELEIDGSAGTVRLVEAAG